MSPMRGPLQVAMVSAVLCAAPARADVTGHYAYASADPEIGPSMNLSMTVEVSDNGNFRLQLPGVPYSVLSLAGRLYLVKSDERPVQVMRAEDVGTILAEHAGDQGTGKLVERIDELESRFTWKEIGPINLAGWNGVSFGLSFDDGPTGEASGLAVSSDPRLRPLARPFLEVQSRQSGMFGRLLTIIPPGSRPVFERGGPLQIMALRLVDADFAPIDASHFSLPAEPLTLDEIRSSGALFPKSDASIDEPE